MKKRRIFATALSTLMLLASVGGMTACGGGDNSASGGDGKYVYNVPGENKLTIKVKNFGGGPGNVWLEEAAERFAQLKQNEKYGNKKYECFK
jgi:ABC-type glycerol-3-phosphate transport system substrate-binding protein